MKHIHVVPYFLIIFFTVVMIITATVVYAAPPTQYKEVATTVTDLNGKVFVDSDATGFNTYLEDGFIIISGHGQKTVKLKWIALKNSVKTLNGHTIRVQHRNDAGVIDSIVTYDFDAMEDNQGFVYFDADFSEVIIGGFVGSYTKTDLTIYNNMTNFSYGQSLTNISSVTVNVTQGYDSALSKYGFINSTNPDGWWPFDDNYTDMSGNGNDATPQGGNIDFDNVKYDNGTNSNSLTDWVIINNINITDAATIVVYVQINTWNNYRDVLGFGNTSTNRINLELGDDGTILGYMRTGNVAQVALNSNPVVIDELNCFVYTINTTAQEANLYHNNELTETDTSFILPNTNDTNLTIFQRGDMTSFANAIVDNLIFYNRVITETERNNLYYDTVQELRIRTNSNSTWSGDWNSTSDNPLSVPFGAGETLTHLQFMIPTEAVVDGVITRDYNSTAQASISSTVVYGEDIIKLSESAAGMYLLDINHTAFNSGTGHINYSTTNNLLLDADFTNPATLTTDNPNATLSSTLPYFNISTGYVASGTEYNYLIRQYYFYPPTNLATTALENSINITWTATPNADIYSIYQKNKSIFWTDETITIDGLDTETSWADAQKFILPSPNFVNVDDYDSIAGLHDANNFYVFVNAIDDDTNNIDDVSTLYGDFLNDGLTTDDGAWEVREDGHINRLRWSGSDWISAPGSAAVAAVTGAGTSTITAEFSIPISELGANFTNGSFMPMLWGRECAALNPDIYTYHPTDNTNNTDVSLWEHVNIEASTSGHVFLANTTNLYYNVTGLDVFEWYNFGVSAWNGSQETSDDHVSGVTLDLTEFLVSGYILDADGNGIDSAIVWAKNGLVAGVEQTNASGYYERHLYAADYTFYANKSGYHTNSIAVSVSGNLTNQNITLSVYSNADLWAKLLEIEDKIDALSSDFTPTEGNYEMLSSTYNIFLLLLGACFILSFPKRGEVTERDTGLNNVLFSFIGTILSMFLAQIIVSGQVVESFEFASQIYDPLQHYLLYMVAIIMFVIFVLNILHYAKQRWD